ncbi:hypothetical protein UFOVP1549_61 [uncultured Caudovirales phage]|uniref:Uncharacterized protein n=1 Tax=uncultured Caudovirales phage TaxID=2100421 RepID=A0A6J7XEY8_9CAUD|nr:hypothetical protein UFOVP303_33 [uncultured Caudovirales phage]CAB5228739.1 hypothetical protein UFOVP1549_61 [uncultured Caudovirales phage]
MKHFAKIENNIISQIIAIEDSDCNGLDFPNSETVGKQYIENIGLTGDWIETSITGLFRQRYAWIGGSYNSEFNCFVNPQPYPSWIMNNFGEWDAPVPYPTDAGEHDVYTWNEENLAWEFQFSN